VISSGAWSLQISNFVYCIHPYRSLCCLKIYSHRTMQMGFVFWRCFKTNVIAIVVVITFVILFIRHLDRLHLWCNRSMSGVSVALNRYRRILFLHSSETTCVNMAVIHILCLESQTLAKKRFSLKVFLIAPLSLFSNSSIHSRYLSLMTCLVTVQSQLYGALITFSSMVSLCLAGE